MDSSLGMFVLREVESEVAHRFGGGELITALVLGECTLEGLEDGGGHGGDGDDEEADAEDGRLMPGSG